MKRTLFGSLWNGAKNERRELIPQCHDGATAVLLERFEKASRIQTQSILDNRSIGAVEVHGLRFEYPEGIDRRLVIDKRQLDHRYIE
jgi:hypothetical protein